MKTLSKQIAASFFAYILCIGTIHAQQFKWVKGGGTVYDFSALPSNESEQTKFMCIDPNGNVYALSIVGDDPIVADTFHGTPYGGTDNILLTSYNCSGQMRWAKLISSSSASCTPFGIVADSLGHIYVAGEYPHTSGTLHIGYDTAITGSIYSAIGLIQLDTNGHFDWIRFIGNNTLSTLTATITYSDPITIDGTNNTHYFCYLKSGLVFMPGDTSHYGVYDVSYDISGTLLSAIRLDLDSQWILRGVVIDPVTNKLYACGEINTSLGTDTFFAAALDASRNLLWQYFAGHGDDDAFTGITLDQSKHLYFSGSAQPFLDTTRFVFNNDSVSAPHFFDISVIVKTDTNGTVGWIKHFDGNSTNGLFGITLIPGNLLAATGSFFEEVINGYDTINAGVGMDPFITIVDTGGNLLTLKRIHGDGYYDLGNAITSDKIGNIYIGGMVTDSIPNTLIPAYHSIGGNTDFFVMKYGVDCSCTSMPVANYTDTGIHIIGFNYSGTTAGIDSVVWNFGDGSATTTSTAPLHTYTATGTYDACVTVYSSCGSDLHCSEISIAICTITPTASFSDTGTHTVGFTYTGTSIGLDSVRWNFGDGSTSTSVNPLHTYTTSGTYTVCVTVYTACGVDSSCSNVVVNTTGIVFPSLSNVNVYPNPTNDELNITGVQHDISYRLLSVTGVSMLEGKLKHGSNALSLKNFPPGIYILELLEPSGEKKMVRVVKE